MKTLEVSGGRLSYWDVGEGPAIVFIHGVGTNGELWFGDLEPLADTHRLVVHDRRGYGHSSESPRNWRTHREDVERLLDALGIQRAAIVGYSGGAIIALDLVLARPDLATALVLVDPAVGIKHCVTPGMVANIMRAKLLRRLRGERRGAEAWLRFVGSYSTGGTAFDKASAHRRETLLANASGIFADADSIKTEDIAEARLAEIAAPVTIIEAKLSPPFLRKSCERLRRLMPQARVVTIEKAGHHIAIDAKDELLAHLRAAVAPPSRSPAS